jgi:hypothetical protein
MRSWKLLLSAIALFNICIAQVHESNLPTSYAAKQYLSFSSSFTDSSLYNMYDFAGNPLGNLDRSTNVVELNVGYRFLNMSGNSGSDSASTYNGFVLPVISLRPSPNLHIGLNYSLQPIESNDFSMPLHQFGFSLVSQTKNGIFRAGLAGQGYLGTETQNSGSDTRTLMGIRDMGICIGSKINPTVNIGLYAHAAFYVDTLFNSNQSRILEERFASVELPQIDATIDINMQKVPDQAVFSYTYAKNHFVYTQKTSDLSAMVTFHTITGLNSLDNQWDADPIVNDSIEFSFKDMYRIDLGHSMALTPSIALGYMHNNFVRMKPGADNNPFDYNGQDDGYEWHTQSFGFGVGSAFQICNASKLWVEFYRSALSLSLDGDHFAESLKDSDSKALYRFGCGTTFDIAKAVAPSGTNSVALTVGYLLDQHNDLLSSYRGEAFSHILPMTVNNQLERYQPWNQFRQKVSSSSFHAGLSAAFKEETFVTGLYFVYTSNSISGLQSGNTSATELGLDLTYNVKARSK